MFLPTNLFILALHLGSFNLLMGKITKEYEAILEVFHIFRHKVKSALKVTQKIIF